MSPYVRVKDSCVQAQATPELPSFPHLYRHGSCGGCKAYFVKVKCLGLELYGGCMGFKEM